MWVEWAGCGGEREQVRWTEMNSMCLGGLVRSGATEPLLFIYFPSSPLCHPQLMQDEGQVVDVTDRYQQAPSKKKKKNTRNNTNRAGSGAQRGSGRGRRKR